MVLEMVQRVRKRLPKTGTRKLYQHMQEELQKQEVKIGRDKLFHLLRSTGLLIKKTKRFHITTDSKHFYYKSPNLVKDLHIEHAEQVFVSDITYIKTDECHAYLALVTDAYSKKIMGWALEKHMRVELVKQALEMAKRSCIHDQESIIHHSDRGLQYCCPDYSEFAQKRGFVLSTTQKYDPYENAIAERINGILKYEFGLKRSIKSLQLAQKMTAQAVYLYNNERLHWSLDLQTPQDVHTKYNKQTYKSYKREAA